MICLAIGLITLCTPTFAQDDKLDELTFEETIIQEEKVPYFGVGGGFMISLFSPNLDDVNSQLTKNGIENLSAPITMTGALGVATIGIIPNVRVSISSLGGISTTPETAFNISGKSYNRKVQYYNGYTGFGADYAISLAKSLYLLPGISAGWGTLSIETSQALSGANTSNSGFGGLPTDNNIYSNRLQNSYVLLQPGVSVEFAPALLGSDKPRVITVRLHAGYTASFMGDWKENGNTIVNDQPSTLNASGLNIQAGIMIGLFN